jgi:hypothetical protein
VSGNDLILGIHEDRICEAQYADAFGHLPDLMLGVRAGVFLVGL